MLARDALMNNPLRLLETGKPVAMKVARRVWEGAVGKGLASVSTSLAAYFIKTWERLSKRFSSGLIFVFRKRRVLHQQEHTPKRRARCPPRSVL